MRPGEKQPRGLGLLAVFAGGGGLILLLPDLWTRLILFLGWFLLAGGGFWILARRPSSAPAETETSPADPVSLPVLLPEAAPQPAAAAAAPEESSWQSEGLPVAREFLEDNLSDWNSALQELQNIASVGDDLQRDLMTFQTLKLGSDFIADNVLRAYEISDNLANTAKQAFELSEHVQKGVKIVTDSLGESLKNTTLLFEQSKRISKILEIMSDVSEKIHILSINASIVSARAGLSGKGFEVVAKEIRNLAKETENSLKDIEIVIHDVQSTIGVVIEKVQFANQETEQEKNALMSVGGSLQGVILAVEIIRAVTSVAKEKAEEQNSSLVESLKEMQREQEDVRPLQNLLDRLEMLRDRELALQKLLNEQNAQAERSVS